MGSLRRAASDFFRGSSPPQQPPETHYSRGRNPRAVSVNSGGGAQQRSESPSALDELSFIYQTAKAAITGKPQPQNPYLIQQPHTRNQQQYRGSTNSGMSNYRNFDAGRKADKYAHRDEQFFGQYNHLNGYQNAAEALNILRRLASAVMPIMRKRGWKVGTLSEFYPENPGLLGLNVNHGQQIMVRLRSPYNPQQFLRFEHCLDTLLHELVHIVQGPHDAVFHRMWNELRVEWEELFARGYTGEGFLGTGKQLGGNYVPAEEVRRRARVAAVERERERIKRGRKLGSSSTDGRSGSLGVRDSVAIAAIKRASLEDSKPRKDRGKGKGRATSVSSTTSDEEITAGCGQGSERAKQEANDAMTNGFATKDDMDEANWIAIQEAQFELEQMEEQKRLMMGLPPTTQQPSVAEEGGYTWDPEYGLRTTGSSTRRPELPKSTPPQAQQMPKAPPEVNSRGNPVSKIVKEAEQKRLRKPQVTSSAAKAPLQPESSSFGSRWNCSACTFVNRGSKTTCEICETERQAPKSAFSQSLGWNCHTCGSFMGHEWWTCSGCGTMKLSS